MIWRRAFRSLSQVMMAGLIVVGMAAGAAIADVEYDVIDLGTLGGTGSAAFGMNDRGQVVGWALDSEGLTQAFVWQNGTMTGLGFFPGDSNSVARAINNNGQITGYASVSNKAHAFIYATNTLIDLGTLGGNKSWGHAINEQGDIAGASRFTNASPSVDNPIGFFWRSNQFTRIRPYHNWLTSDANGINKDGRVCGTTFLWATSWRWWAYVWYDANANGIDEESEMQVLGALGSTNWMYYTTSGANAINDAGQVVGYTSVTTSPSSNEVIILHAFLVTPSGGSWKSNPDDLPPVNTYMQELGTLDGFTNYSYANDINNNSWIVGTSTMSSGTNNAFLWRYGAMTNLNDLINKNSGWVLTNATAINEHNEIVGSGLHNGQERAFLLTKEGRITHFDPVYWIEYLGIFTNEFDQVWTQAIYHLEAQVLQWAGLWGTNTVTSRVFTVESTDSLKSGNWHPYEPTSQWPITENIWTITNFDTAGTTRFFRVRAE